ncbi:MAG: diguanylate cyclase domain-containing protein [Erythrobacter sp.]
MIANRPELAMIAALPRCAAWAQSLMLGIGLCVLLIFVQPASTTDRHISDGLLVPQAHLADPDYLLIEITSQDVIDYGRPALSRANLTRLLAQIAAQQPERVLLDFSADREIKDEVQRERAEVMERLGPGQLGLVTGFGPHDVPAARYAQAATLLDGRLTPDADGWHRMLGREGRERGNNPAIWLATGKAVTHSVPLDLRIDHSRYERASAHDVFVGKVRATGRKVIISASPEVGLTRAYLPHADTASRASVLAIASQSAAQDYPAQRARGDRWNTALAMLAAALGMACGAIATSGSRFLMVGLAALLAIAITHFSLAVYLGVPVTLVNAISCFLILANATLAQRFRIFPMMQNFIRGDLSPEEAWAWRAQEESAQPAFLFGVDGKIKRANGPGKQLAAAFGEGLAAACLPRMGARANEISFDDADGSVRWFRLTWPYSHVQLAQGWDVTEARQHQERLIGQLYTDDLTGCMNRRGFDQALAELSGKTDCYHIFFIDLNGFKAINDSFGHDAGDELLVVCAHRLQRLVRSGDCVARLGGDEFAILASALHADIHPQQIIDRIVATIAAPVDLQVVKQAVMVGAAVGHAAPLTPNEDVGEVLRRADQAMYRHKQACQQRKGSSDLHEAA